MNGVCVGGVKAVDGVVDVVAPLVGPEVSLNAIRS